MNKPLALVTGASRGIGKAIALRLKSHGYVVVGLYKSNAPAAEALLAQGVDMHQADVSQEAGVVKAIDYVMGKYGRLDIVVNNAGIDIPGVIKDYPMEAWDQMVATDLTSVFLMSKYAIPHLMKSDDACIINISSRIGLNDYAESEFVAYGAVKAAVNNFTVGLARELAQSNIRVNAIIPTPTKTDLFDAVFTDEDEKALKTKGKLGAPKDVADLVVKVIEDKAMTGELVFDERVFL